MNNRSFKFLITVVLVFISAAACANGDVQNNSATNSPKPAAAPSKNFTAADVAKLKWIEGSWRGMDGDKPFYERYRIEGTAMIVEGLKEDGSPDGDPTRFELRDGEFGTGAGDKRSAASEITADYIQFVPAAAGKGNSYRFERQSDGTWIALLEWTAADKTPQKKIYKMELWPPKK